jgi:hypothetical protein
MGTTTSKSLLKYSVNVKGGRMGFHYTDVIVRKSQGHTGAVPLECGANILTSLHATSSIGQLEVMWLLADRDANVNTQDRFLVTPLRQAGCSKT